MKAQTKEAEPLSRVERKRQETRERIIQAANELMRSRPVEDVTISDITSAADIGHGTFYLHFKSKYEVLIPIIDKLSRDWDVAIQRHVRQLDDPAEVMAFSARQMARVIAADPLWRWLLEHSGVPVEDVRDAIGRFAARDFGKGLLSGRFQVPDLTLTSSFTLGAFVSSLLASFKSDDQETALDNMVELLLRTLGISMEEAHRIAHLPFKPITLSESPSA